MKAFHLIFGIKLQENKTKRLLKGLKDLIRNELY